MNYDMNELLSLMVEQSGSDLHIQPGVPPTMRVSNELIHIDGPPLSAQDTEQLMQSIANEADMEEVRSHGNSDFGFTFMDKARFRVSLHKTKGAFGFVMRNVPNKILDLDSIGFPDVIRDLLVKPRGLILVTGPTGSGKSTSLASMMDWINTNRETHIITIEDPIEYLYEHKRSIITQKEVGIDVKDFPSALRGALRQDPDIILVGELRDLETIKAALTAAETGHLVFGTLHTTGAARTVDRIVDAFPGETRSEVRAELASVIQAVISQTLLKKVGGGLVAAYEIMINTHAIAALIREGKTFRIDSEIQTGSRLGMVGLDVHIQSLYRRGIVDALEATEKAQDTAAMKQFVRDNPVKIAS